MQCSLDICRESWEVRLDRFPDDGLIDIEISVSDRVTHLLGECQRQFRVGFREPWMFGVDVVGGFTSDFQISNDGILYQGTAPQHFFALLVGVFADSHAGLEDLLKKVRQVEMIFRHDSNLNRLSFCEY